jgi:hypothetical protein
LKFQVTPTDPEGDTPTELCFHDPDGKERRVTFDGAGVCEVEDEFEVAFLRSYGATPVTEQPAPARTARVKERE